MNRSTIWKFYGYRVSVSNGFWLPVGTLYLQQVRGFGLDEIGIVMGGFSIAMVLAEVPTGYVGDRLGRRASLVFGNLVLATFMIGYTLVESVEAYLALHVFWAFGWAFRSGTADAWLYELLAVTGDDDEFARIRGRASTAQMGFEALTAAVAGLLVTYGWALPFLANGVVALAGIPILLSTPAVDADEDAPEESGLGVRDAVSLLRTQVNRPEVRWIVVYYGLFSVLYQILYTYEQPAMETVGVSAAGLGVVYALFKLAAAAAASGSGWIRDRFGTRAAFGLVMPVFAVGFLGVAVFPLFVVPVFALNRSVMSAMGPIRNQYLNDRLDDAGRATVLSGVSMVLISAGGAAKFLAGQAAAVVGVVEFLTVVGLVVPVLAAVLWVAVSPVRGTDATRAAGSSETAASD